jgi:hypothetical protein
MILEKRGSCLPCTICHQGGAPLCSAIEMRYSCHDMAKNTKVSKSPIKTNVAMMYFSALTNMQLDNSGGLANLVANTGKHMVAETIIHIVPKTPPIRLSHRKTAYTRARNRKDVILLASKKLQATIDLNLKQSSKKYTARRVSYSKSQIYKLLDWLLATARRHGRMWRPCSMFVSCTQMS